MTDADNPDSRKPADRNRLLEENRRLAQRCIELEAAARRQLEKLRAANAILSHGEADLRVLLENAAVGFALVDLNLRVASANRTLAETLGYTQDELAGVNFSNFVYVGKLPAFTRLVNRNAKNARADEIVELVGRDGGLIPCRMAASHWLDDNDARQGHFLLVFDAGAELNASGRLREAEQAMAEAERSRRLFLDVVGRELRTPAGGIMGMARMLLDAGLNDRQKELVGVIHSSASSLVRLVNDVVDVVHMDAVDTRPQSIPVRLADLAEGTMNLFSLRAEEKGLELRIHTGPAVPETAMLDPHIVRRVLAHLLDNALKFTERGHVALSIDALGDNLRFMVSDTGPGLDAVAEAELFNNTLPTDSAAARRHGGIGVGLAICRRLVASMGGRIAHESNPGGGSEFHVLVPLVEAPADAAREKIEPPAEALHLPELNILLADVNPLSGRMIRAYLGFDGHKLTMAESGTDAVEKCRAGIFDLAIIDMNLPKLDGVQTVKLIREEEKNTARKRLPVLLLGSAGQLREEAFYTRAGADGLLKKPIQPIELMAAAAAATGVKPLTVSRRQTAAYYSSRGEGSSIRRLDGRQLVNLRQVMSREQFVGLLRFFMEDAVPGLFAIEKMVRTESPDRQRIAFAAGKALGLASYLGFSALADLLKRIENAGRMNTDEQTLRRLVGELADVTDDSLEELKRILPEAFITISDMRGDAPENAGGAVGDPNGNNG